MLTPLQRRLASIVSLLPEAEDFALAGGAALIAHHVVDRATRDLDYFGPAAQAVRGLLPALVDALEQAGLTVQIVRVHDDFARLEVAGGGETCELDLARDARIHPPAATELGRTLSVEELAADKLLAFVDRAAARDLMDLDRLVALLGLPTVLAAAAEKDTGFRIDFLATAVRASDRLPSSEFGITEIEYAALRERAASWTEAALQLDREGQRVTDEYGDGLDLTD